MLYFCFLAVLLIQANAQYQCEDEIKTEVIEDYEQLVGNWTFLTYWENLDDEDQSEEDDDSQEKDINCAILEISEASEDDIQSMQESCKNDYYDFFDYANAKYKLMAPEFDIEKSLISVGSEKSIMGTCGFINSLQVRRVSDDYMVMINHEGGSVAAGLLAKKIPEEDELACLMYNIDAIKGLDAYPYCYNDIMEN